MGLAEPEALPANLADFSCAQLLHSYMKNTASPVEALSACYERIDAVDKRLMAVITRSDEVAQAQAKASEKRWRDGTPLPLDGVPFGVKDLIYTAGIRTTGGSLVYENFVPDYNATVVDRLLDAGAVLAAKLQTWEFAADGVPFGFTRNPWNLEHMSGGSSSGSAAAIAARELPLAIGTDTGGSIRVPTSFCGITSMKPTFGRISRHGVMPISWTLDHVGPMATSAEDIALAMEAIAGYDERDPSSLRAPVDQYTRHLGNGLKGVRLGVPQNWFFELCDPQIAESVHRAIDVMRELGATVVDVRIPIFDQLNPVSLLWLITNPECASLHEVNTDKLDLYNPDNANHVLGGRAVLAIDYMRALRLRGLIQRDFEKVLSEVDAVITPGTLCVAPRIEREDSIVDAWAVIGEKRYPWLEIAGRTTCVFNLAGMPALTFPCGFNSAGLPMSVQVAARPQGEATALRIGYAFQRATDHHRHVPPMINQAASARAERPERGE
jgi:aspartyl-tRNA(Asn)/glutamyl-tRNA(Gln) amidotransferase subunit A